MDPMYLVVEIKTVPNEGAYAIVTDSWQFTNRNNAESQYHSRLAAAARSEYIRHAVVMMTNEGFLLDSKCYAHDPEPEPEPEIEPETEPETPTGE